MCAQLLQEGKALKLLATAARLDVEDFLQKKVYLEVQIYDVFCPVSVLIIFNLDMHFFCIILSFK